MTKKDIETQERFITLRAQGWTFQRIAEDLGVSKQTLINWSKDLQEELGNKKALELEALAEKYYLTREKRLELYGEKLDAVNAELDRRIEDGSLTKPLNFSTAKLFDLLFRLHALLEKEAPALDFMSEDDIKAEKAERELFDDLRKPRTFS